MLLKVGLTASFCREECIGDQVPVVLVAHRDSCLWVREYLICVGKYTKVRGHSPKQTDRLSGSRGCCSDSCSPPEASQGVT